MAESLMQQGFADFLAFSDGAKRHEKYGVITFRKYVRVSADVKVQRV